MKYLNEMLKWNKENGYLINQDIKRQIQKQIRIHKKYIYRLDRVEQFIDFTESNFMLTTGDLKPIILLPTQKWWIELMLGYDMLNEQGEQVQLTNEVFLNVGRGTGKSSLMATRVLNWMLLSGQFGGEAQVIAYDNNQAKHVYEQVKNQAKASPLLSELSENNQFKSTKTGLLFQPLLTKFIKQTNDTNRAQGGNTSLNIFDEVHTYTSDITEAVNKGSRQKQKNWQSIYITSGGTKRNGLYDTMIINSANPSSYIGGVWERFANGRTMVGVDESDSVTLMNTANNMGGSTNPLTRHGHSIKRAGGSTQTAVGATINWANDTSVGVVQEAGDNTDHNNWQPFVTVYFWKRIA